MEERLMNRFLTENDWLTRLIRDRRHFHRHPEPGWMEFRTTAFIAGRLEASGYSVALGEAILDPAARMGLPKDEELERAYDHALRSGADIRYLEPMKGGRTGVVGTIGRGSPVTAFRFDIDALPIVEASGPRHRPAREQFRSENSCSHACGHDGHMAIGLSLAEWLAQNRSLWKGTVKLIFQPAEEGCRGAQALAAAGVVDGVDSLICLHLGMGVPSGAIAAGAGGFFATSKYEAAFTGQSAHAALEPEKGNNAMLAAAAAVMQLHAIERHSQAKTRVNVGYFLSDGGLNVIPERAVIRFEIRSTDDGALEHLDKRARDILSGAALSYGTVYSTIKLGHAATADSDAPLAERIAEAARQLPEVQEIRPRHPFGASEDAAILMKKVQQNGGCAAYIVVGSDLASGHHTPKFDIDENSMLTGFRILTETAVRLNNGE